MKQIYSDYLEKMIPSGFTVDGTHYTWDEDDLLYWSDETDEDYYMSIPNNAVLD